MKQARLAAIGAWGAAFLTLLLALLWSRHVQTAYLIAGVLSWAAAVALIIRARKSRLISLPLIAAVVLLAFSLIAQTFTAWRIARLADDWPRLVEARDANLKAMLDRRVGNLVDRGVRAASEAARSATTSDTTALFQQLALIQESSKVDAIAVFGEAGQLIAWAGEHRAQLLGPVRQGASAPLFVEQPLYSYVYFPGRTRTLPRRHVVAAVLLGTAVHEHAHDMGDQSIAHVLSHIGATFRAGPGPPESWPLVLSDDTIAHARFAPLTQSAWRARTVTLAQRVISMFAALALVLLSIAWLRRPNRRLATTVPLLAATLSLALAPLGAFGLEQLFSPAMFLLPLPGDASLVLGTLLGILVALGALAASVQNIKRLPRLPTVLLVLGAVVIAVAYPGAVRLLVGPGEVAADDRLRAAGAQLLEGGPAFWFGLQIAAVLLLGIITELALPRWSWTSPLQATSKLRSPWLLMLLGALATSGALSVLILLLGQTRQWISPWVAAAWALPFLLAALAIAAYRGRGVRLIRWVTAGWLAASLVLPYMWIAHVDARLDWAERELRTLGATSDPLLEYLLMQFSRETMVRAQNGETGYLLLYRSWVGSGLAREAYPARLTIWSPEGLPEMQLHLGNMEETTARPAIVPPYLEAAFARVRENPDSAELMGVQAVADVNLALIRALDSARVVTVEIPPRRSLEHRDIPFLATNTPQDMFVELVPARFELRPSEWVPSENGWRSETLVHFADGDYHAHMEVRVPSFGVRIARGVLLLALDLALFALLWLIGRAARGEHLALRSGWRDWRGSFRARVTATLFLFFLIPTAFFGWVAFGALAREVTRATRIVAERAARQAVVEFQDAGGDLAELADHAGTEILYYFQGELSQASTPEARDLGVYGAWMPPGVFQTLTRGDEDAAVATRHIAGQDVLTAFRSLAPATTGFLGVPMSLASGETAIRQRELAHVILFAAIMGGLLSLLLSVTVGRALTGPIGRLQRAAAKIGSGNLHVRMPENTGDEFGQLFASFNRMVRRLRRARAQQIRTARVLAWGEMARQVAHEIKNPLTPIKLAVQHLKRAYADGKTNYGEVLDESVEQILIEIDRLSEIARAFSRYGAPAASSGPLEQVDVRQVIREALTLYRAGDPDVEYVEHIDPEIPRVMARSGELKEVLLNLLENARAVLEDSGGRIVVSAQSANEGVAISVTDNGPGIPSDFLSRVFEPHFSTRSAGTGLGLAIVRRLVESWGGSVTAESELGAGTTIRVTLLPQA